MAAAGHEQGRRAVPAAADAVLKLVPQKLPRASPWLLKITQEQLLWRPQVTNRDGALFQLPQLICCVEPFRNHML